MGGSQILKEELRQKITIPQYLRLAMRDAIQSRDVAAGEPPLHLRFQSMGSPSICRRAVSQRPRTVVFLHS
ncbi:unnamed protein product [Camellia sinensis]